jgi:PAS domain S-box-containing protein
MSISRAEAQPFVSDPRRRDTVADRFQAAAGILAALVLLAGAAVFAGWWFDIPSLKSIFPNVTPMNADTALAMLLSAAALWVYQAPSLPRWRDALLSTLTGVSSVIALLALVEHISGFPIGVDDWLFANASSAGQVPLSTSTTIIFLNAALFVSDRTDRLLVPHGLLLGAIALSVVNIIGFFFGTDVFRGLAAYTAMAVHSSWCLLLLCAGAFFARPADGFMSTVADEGPGGFVVRRLLPAVFLLPAALAWMAWRAEQAGLFGSNFTFTLFVASSMAALATVVWLAGSLVQSQDRRRESAETERWLSEERLRHAVSDAPVPMIIHDDRQQIVHMSRGWTELSGYSIEDTPTVAAWLNQAQPYGKAEVEAYLRRLDMTSDTIRSSEAPITTKSGQRRYWEFSTTPLGALASNRRSFLTMAVDVTDRRTAEEDLRRINESLEQRIQERMHELTEANQALERQSAQLKEQAALLDLSNDGILVRDLSGTIIYWSAGAERMFGWRRDEVLGRNAQALLQSFFPQALADIERQVLEQGHWEGEVVEVRRNGAQFSVDSRWTLTRTARGTPQGILEIHRDITERKLAERVVQLKNEELARSNQELEQFAYVASHDLQEPLRMVSNYTQLLARRYRDKLDTDANEFIDFAVDGAKRMQALIHDLLQLARVGTRGKEFRQVPAETIVRDALTNLAGSIEESGAEIVVEPLPALAVDASQLVHVFQNLIGNALKFRRKDAKPVVRISAKPEETAWRFFVADNGIGIEPKYFERIFQMFQRLHGRDQYEGTGIGLALCKKIVERHGGRIQVESQAGQGATFSFTIPYAAKPPEPARGAP